MMPQYANAGNTLATTMAVGVLQHSTLPPQPQHTQLRSSSKVVLSQSRKRGLPTALQLHYNAAVSFPTRPPSWYPIGPTSYSRDTLQNRFAAIKCTRTSPPRKSHTVVYVRRHALPSCIS